MMARRAGWFILLLLALSLAGCQQQVASPAPNFLPPVFQPPQGKLPGAGAVLPTRPPATGAVRPPIKTSGGFDAYGFGVINGDAMVYGAPISPRAKIKNKQWRYIVIHHSDTNFGSAHRFDRAHRARGWEMLGYDFVIGNGSETPDGQIEIGPRWAYQLEGAHTGTPSHEYNNWGIGICMVGNFEQTRPTRAQMESLAKLCAYFMRTYHIPAGNILGHRDCKPTDCPGHNMDIVALRKLALSYLNAGKR